jgi:hypothetical protein
MSSRYLLFVIVVGGLAHLILYLADREISAGIDRLSEATLARPESLDANSNLKLVSARSPYMRPCPPAIPAGRTGFGDTHTALPRQNPTSAGCRF